MLVKDLVVIATVLIVGGAVGSIVWRVVRAPKNLRALQDAVDIANAETAKKAKGKK